MAENIPQLGKLIEGEAFRDAIHIAIAPVVATTRLTPGQAIGFTEPGNPEKVGPVENPIGIVDPYMDGPVFINERFWMFLYPQTITSLRHHWTHPAFGREAAPVDKSASEKWMREFAAGHYDPYDDDHEYTMEDVLDAATEFINGGDKHIQRGSSTLQGALSYEHNKSEFWYHYTVLTGRIVLEEYRDDQPFSCTC